MDTFKDNPEAASDYIKPLLQFVAAHIPVDQQKETILFILATAGMRMIPEEWVFDLKFIYSRCIEAHASVVSYHMC